jgi:glycerol kinase
VIKGSSEIEPLAKSVKDNEGVYFVPAFTGLGAPYWDAHARALICGLTRGTGAGHIARAALESIAYQTKDVFDIMLAESGKQIRSLKVDGGACRNNILMQFQNIDSTALGAAQLAGVMIGLWKGKKALTRLHKKERTFVPRMNRKVREGLYHGWVSAVEKTRLK